MIDNNIDDLIEPTRTKVKVLMSVVKSVYPSFASFETLRSLMRQKQLVKTGASGTLQSLHRLGMAVDRIFLDKKGNPTRKGDYGFVQWIAIMCGLQRTTRKGENGHTEENGKSIQYTMATNSERRKKSDKTTKKYLAQVNTEFRKYGYK